MRRPLRNPIAGTVARAGSGPARARLEGARRLAGTVGGRICANRAAEASAVGAAVRWCAQALARGRADCSAGGMRGALAGCRRTLDSDMKKIANTCARAHE